MQNVTYPSNSATNLLVARKQKPFLDSMFSPDVIKMVDSMVKQNSLAERNSLNLMLSSQH